MFGPLPQEIIQYIYEFDNTYKELFDKVLEDVIQFQIFSCHDIFYVYDTLSDIMYCTDSVSTPSWICSSFRISRQQMKDIIRRKKLKRRNECKLQYDITTFQFQPDLNELRYL